MEMNMYYMWDKGKKFVLVALVFVVTAAPQAEVPSTKLDSKFGKHMALPSELYRLQVPHLDPPSHSPGPVVIRVAHVGTANAYFDDRLTWMGPGSPPPSWLGATY